MTRTYELTFFIRPLSNQWVDTETERVNCCAAF